MSDKTGWNAAANVTIKLLEVKLDQANARLAQMDKLLRESFSELGHCATLLNDHGRPRELIAKIKEQVTL